jgi:hypothetical protein
LFRRLDTEKYDQSPYSRRYPALVNLLKDEPALPKGNTVTRNIAFGGRRIELLDSLDERTVHFEKNLVNVDPGFVFLKSGDFRLKRGSPAFENGFRKIPQEKIGLHADKYRKTIPRR